MPAKLRESKHLGSRHHEKRRGHRMNSRVPVRLEWVVLKHSLSLEHRVALTNMISATSNAAIVVWKGNQRPDGWEYGVELVAPEMDFWGLEL